MHCYYHYADSAGVSLCFFFCPFFLFFFLEISLVTQAWRFLFSFSPFSFILSFSSSSRDDARWLTKRLLDRNVPSTSANLQCASGFRFLLILLISFDLSLRARYVLLLISLRNGRAIRTYQFLRSFDLLTDDIRISRDRSSLILFRDVKYVLVKWNCELY